MSLQKLWAIAWKELYTTLRDRNLILIMFATPLVLSTIIGLAFGGLGSDSPTISTIDVAVVNLDTGFDLDSIVNNTASTGTETGTVTDTVNNTAGISAQTLDVTSTNTVSGLPTNFTLNLGDIVAGILLGESITATGGVSGTGFVFTDGLSCTLTADESADAQSNTFQGSLSDLIAATQLADAQSARLGVEQGTYAAAVIIPPGFSGTIVPSFGTATALTATTTVSGTSVASWPQIEVYGNSGDSLSAGIVNAIVSGIVGQFARLPVTLEATVETAVEHVNLDALDLDALERFLTDLAAATESRDFRTIDIGSLTSGDGFTSTNTFTDTFAILGCLFTPGINPVTVEQQPLDSLQEGNSFARVLVAVGSGQAVFFALFTGVFGILSIYDERKQWTLQRMLASPTGGNTILLGKLLGNLITVIAQLIILMIALSVVASFILGEPTSIWGTHFGLLLVVVVFLSLAVSGIGVLVVGLARTPEQVQIIGPVVNMMLGVFGAAFGFSLPEPLPSLSLITWGTDAFTKLAASQLDIGLNLSVLLGQGLLLFLVGSWFFRRRLNL